MYNIADLIYLRWVTRLHRRRPLTHKELFEIQLTDDDAHASESFKASQGWLPELGSEMTQFKGDTVVEAVSCVLRGFVKEPAGRVDANN